MKDNIVLIGFLGVLFACNGAEENKNPDSNNLKDNLKEEIISKEERDVTILEVEEEDKSSELTSEERTRVLSEDNLYTSTDSEGTRDSISESLDGSGEKATTTPSPESNDAEETAEEGQKSSEPITIFLEVVPDEMRFNKDAFTVAVGQEVIIELENMDGMEHNMLISIPGSLKKVGAAADALARDPKGAEKEYVPEIPEVLFATKMLDPGDFATLKFVAPKEPGEYPFVCTFPGHWRMMNGVMKVVAAE